MSLKIDEYLSSCGAVSELLKQQSTTENVSTQKEEEKDQDSYVSTIGSSEEALPCENYNDILQVIRKAKAEAGVSEDETEETGDEEAVTDTGGAGGTGGGSDSEEETTTEVVVINGVTYLETTTVVNGVTSVQRTRISEQISEDNADRITGNEGEQKVTDK